MAGYPAGGAGLGPAGLGASPPGLWQPPGFGAGAGGLGAVGEGRHAQQQQGRELELQREISGTIEAQVSRLIEQARQDTENKVKVELKQIRDAMMAMDAQLDQLLAQLDGIETTDVPEAIDGEAVAQLLSKIEQQWGQEIRTLKQELHQTILAHNHNADLIKHHKDTIDVLRERCMKLQGNNVKSSEIQTQLQKLDQRLKQQQKQKKLEPLFERLQILEQRVAAAMTQNAWRYPGMMALGRPGAVPRLPP